jgi:hypothetical protein
VALLMNGIPRLKHVVYDVMSDVLTYIDFNTSDSILPIFGLKTVLFHSMELLSSNHLELVTKLCPKASFLFYFKNDVRIKAFFPVWSPSILFDLFIHFKEGVPVPYKSSSRKV